MHLVFIILFADGLVDLLWVLTMDIKPDETFLRHRLKIRCVYISNFFFATKMT